MSAGGGAGSDGKGGPREGAAAGRRGLGGSGLGWGGGGPGLHRPALAAEPGGDLAAAVCVADFVVVGATKRNKGNALSGAEKKNKNPAAVSEEAQPEGMWLRRGRCGTSGPGGQQPAPRPGHGLCQRGGCTGCGAAGCGPSAQRVIWFLAFSAQP